MTPGRPSPALVLVLAVLALLAGAGPGLPEAHARGGALSGIVGLAYEHGFDEAPLPHAATIDLRTRFLAGERLAACFGVDGRAGIGGGGAVYAAALYPIGLGLRYGQTSHVALVGGVGAGGVWHGDVPLAWTVPVELRWESTGAFRVIRPLLVAQVSRVIAGGQREEEVRRFGPVDAIRALAGLRIMLPFEPVAEIATGDGLFVGVTYDEAPGARTVGVTIGYAVAAHR